MKTVEEIKEKLTYLKIDILDILAIFQMEIKHFIKREYYNSLSTDDIPKNTLYCYSGCRICGGRCPYLDYSSINKEKFCHYERKFDFALLKDECKICGISEGLEDSEDDTTNNK